MNGPWVDTGYRKLLMRRGRLYLRKRVPADVAHCWTGPQVIERTLGTGDVRHAERRARILVGQLETQWAALREREGGSDSSVEPVLGVAPQTRHETRVTV
jgi:hypothetical protein